jgi:hypothetical protein
MNPIQQLQLDIFGRLSAADYFSNVAIYLIRPRSKAEALMIQTQIDNSLAGLEQKNGAAGVACLVEMPYIDVEKPEVAGPYTAIVATVRIIENPLINMASGGTGKSAEDVGSEVLSELHHWGPWGSGHIQRALYAETRALDPDENLIKEGKVAYAATLRTRRSIQPEARAAMPTIIVGSGVTITTTTPGASIYYTIDGSFPWSGNPAATLYFAPFVVPPSRTQIRAVAYATGLQASNVALLSIP